VERPVNRCTQVLHRNAWTPLHNRVKIVDMIAPVGVLISAAALAAPVGWLRDGAAVVHFPVGACGGTLRTPGTYAVPRSGKPRLVFPTSRLAVVAMWGG
jgi:hypothetical protein